MVGNFQLCVEYLQMRDILYLAALHYNEKADRGQATTSSGDPLFKLSCPKSRKGECRAKPVKTEATFYCGDALLDLIFEKVFQDPAPYVNEVLKLIIPEDLSDHTDRKHNSPSPPQRAPAPTYKASVGYIG